MGRGKRLPYSETIDCGENGFGTGAHSDVVGQVHPADCAVGGDEELGGARDILTISGAVGMQYPVLADGFSLGIGEKRKFIPLGLAEFLRIGPGVHTDSHHFHTALMKFVQVLLETPQLGVAERSPVASIEDQHEPAVIL